MAGLVSGNPANVVSAITRDAANGFYAGGVFASPGNNVAHWSNSTWSSLGSGVNGSVLAILRLGNGDIVVGGAFTLAGGTPASRIARWDGAAWHSIGNGFDGNVAALTLLPNGNIVAAGFFLHSGTTPMSRIAQWNGSAWSALAGGFDDTVEALQVTPNGDVIAAGRFSQAGGVPASRIARWNGVSWSPVGSGTNNTVLALGLARGEVIAGGHFTVAGGVPNTSIARIVSSCPAAVAVAGTGCTGSAGPMNLSANDLPWTGSSFTATTVGFPSPSLGAALFGLNGMSSPLSSFTPLSLPGCMLLSSQESTQLLVPNNGQVVSTLAIPNAAAFVGVVLRHQVLAAELDAQGNVTGITSSNALALTIGAF